MPPVFDPYYKWLGIPPQDQPANHYRLLALREFEDDPDVIESAADQRMAHLRTFQSGLYAAHSQKLLNEVAAAKVCLLTPQKRSRYDQELRARLESPARPTARTPAGNGSGFDLSALGVSGDVSASKSAAARAASGNRTVGSADTRRAIAPPDVADAPITNNHTLLIAVGASCLALTMLVVAVLIVRMRGPSNDDTAGDGATSSGVIAAQNQPKQTTPPVAASDELLDGLKAFTTAHPPGPPESPLAKGPLGKGLLLHMSFEPNTIEQRDGRLFVRDLSGAGHHGGSASAQLWGQGKVGAALLCQSPLRIPSAIIDRQPRFTLVAWVSHPASMDEGWWYNEAGASPIFGVSTGKEVNLRSFGAKSRVALRMHVPGVASPPETWNFFALRGSRASDGQASLIIQVNDVTQRIQNDACVPASIGDATRQTMLCTTPGLRIDELIVYDRLLSDAELQTLRARTDPNDGGPQSPPKIVETPKPVRPEQDRPEVDRPELNRPMPLEPPADAVLLNGAKQGGSPAEWMFRWTAVPQAVNYEVKVESPSPEKLTVDTKVVGTSLRMLAHGVVAAENCHGWHWKVRAMVNAQWGPWSDERLFELEPPRNDRGNAPEHAAEAVTQANAAPQSEKTDAAVVRRPLPDAASQLKARDLLNEVYSKTIAAAHNRDTTLAAIAEDMVRKASESRDDPAGLYVLLDRARVLAAEAGGAVLALEIIDEMAKDFEIETLPLKVDTLKICLKKTNLGPEPATEAASATYDVMQELATVNNFDAALALGQLARDHLRKPSDPTVLRKIAAGQNYLHELKAESAKVNSARQMLKTDPNDADAHLAVGRYECFLRRNWQTGLDHLSKGNDAGLRELAAAELAMPRTVADREKLADLWYERAKKEATAAGKTMFFRARYWYESILGEITGLQHTKVDKRIAQIGQLLSE